MAPALSSLTSPRDARPGDAVRVVAPAGRFGRAALSAGAATLAEFGLLPRGPVSMAPAFACAGSIAAREAELVDALGPSAPLVWAARGGSGAGRLAARLPDALWRSFVDARRWLVGFSDITALHACVQAAGGMSLHAANLTNLAAWSEAAREELRGCLSGQVSEQWFAGEGVLAAGHGPAAAAGPLVGGNLTVLASLVGCNVLPDWHGAILLLEDVDEAPYRLARALGQLVDAGCLKGVAGVALGQLTRCEDRAADYAARDWLQDVLAPLAVPIVAGLAIGHQDDSRPVLLGARAELDAGKGRLVVRR